LAEYVGVLILLALVSVPIGLGLAWSARGAARRSQPGADGSEGAPGSAETTPGSLRSTPALGAGYFLAAVGFVVVQAAGLLLVPLVLSFGELGDGDWIYGAGFLLPVVLGIAYLWRKGALGR
jgi:NADH:ubiquinone oxidoreductase subunit 3 (subunit A)